MANKNEDVDTTEIILDSIADGVFTVDREWRITSFNRAAEEINGVDYTHGYLGDMIINQKGDRLYVVDQINFIMLEIDLINKKVLHRTPTGRYPFGICLSPDEKRIYVANVGMFEYSRIASLNPDSIFPEPSVKKGDTTLELFCKKYNIILYP